MSSLSSKLDKARKDEQQKLLQKYNIVDEEGNLTPEGHTVVSEKVFPTVLLEILEDISELEEKSEEEE